MFKKVFIILFSLSLIGFAQSGKPKIALSGTVYDFGKIKQKISVYTKFIIYNIGEDTLKIGDISRTCFCVETKISKKNIAPKDSATLYIKYSPDIRKREQREFINVETNDEESPNVQFTIKAYVVSPKVKVAKNSNAPSIYFPQTTHDFGVVKEGKIYTEIFKFQNKGKAVLQIKNVKTSSVYLKAVILKLKIKPGEEGKIKVNYNTNNQSGNIRRSIRIISNDPIHPKSYLNIFADVKTEKK